VAAAGEPIGPRERGPVMRFAREAATPPIILLNARQSLKVGAVALRAHFP
jgi:hypothetical protein